MAYVQETEAAYAEPVRQQQEKQLQRRARELGFELKKIEAQAQAAGSRRGWRGAVGREGQGTDGLVEAAPGDALGEEVELVLAHVLGVELVRGAAEVAGEVCDGGDRGGNGLGGVVAQAEVVDEPLT
jgi:hypothetical protein